MRSSDFSGRRETGAWAGHLKQVEVVRGHLGEHPLAESLAAVDEDLSRDLVPLLVDLGLLVDVASYELGVGPEQAHDGMVLCRQRHAIHEDTVPRHDTRRTGTVHADLVHEDVGALVDVEDALALEVGGRVARVLLAPLRGESVRLKTWGVERGGAGYLVALLGAGVALVHRVRRRDHRVGQDRVREVLADVGHLLFSRVRVIQCN